MRIGFISDAHGNLPAFECALKILENERVNHIYFLGDAVGYIPHLGVVDCLKSGNILSIRGNHEQMMLEKNFENDPIYQLKRSHQLVSREHFLWLKALPEKLELDFNGVQLKLFHGSPLEPLNGYLYPDTALPCLDIPPGAVIVCGHTHWPMSRRNANGVLFCNPGSVGLPRDNSSLGSLGILDMEKVDFQILRFEIKSITENFIKSCMPVHNSILDFFSSRADRLFLGEKVIVR